MKARVAYAHPDTNQGKITRLEALADAYRAYTQTCIDRMVAERVIHLTLHEFPVFFLSSALTSHLQKCARAQAVATMHDWARLRYGQRLKRRIDEADLLREQKTELYTIGKHRVRTAGSFGKHFLSKEMVELYWSWFWDASVAGNPPSLKPGFAMTLSEMCVTFDAAEDATAMSFWIRVSSLESGDRIVIPLKIPPALRRADTKIAKTVSVRKERTGRWAFQFTDKATVEAFDGSAGEVAVDVGLNVLAATSDGRLLGRHVKPRFDRAYNVVRETRRNRMRQGLYEDSKKLARLEEKLTGMIKTETGAVANQLVRAYPGYTFVIEDLDLSGCKGQKRFAYRALQRSLATKARTKKVNPAYTSQECPSCHHVSRNNRQGTRFQCRCCGRISHADVVGGVNQLGRSEDKLVTIKTTPRDVKTILRARYLGNRAGAAGRSTRRRRPPGCSLQPRKGAIASNLVVVVSDHVQEYGRASSSCSGTKASSNPNTRTVAYLANIADEN